MVLNNVDNIYIGSNKQDRVYLGSQLIWPQAPVGTKYRLTAQQAEPEEYFANKDVVLIHEADKVIASNNITTISDLKTYQNVISIPEFSGDGIYHLPDNILKIKFVRTAGGYPNYQITGTNNYFELDANGKYACNLAAINDFHTGFVGKSGFKPQSCGLVFWNNGIGSRFYISYDNVSNKLIVDKDGELSKVFTVYYIENVD